MENEKQNKNNSRSGGKKLKAFYITVSLYSYLQLNYSNHI